MLVKMLILALACLAAILHACTSLGAAKPAEYKHPSYLTLYDFATPDDLFLSRQLEPFLAGDSPKQWLILNDVKNQVGDWVTQYLDAQQIAAVITDSLPVEG